MQQKEPKRRGGKRPGSGRPHVQDRKQSITVTLSVSDIATLRRLGDGNVSQGIRRLVQQETASHDHPA